jgi:hypothetical protein
MLLAMRALLGLVAITLAVNVANADPHPMSSGATPAPTTDAQIAMTAETLTIDLTRSTADVRAAVTLDNQGPATRIKVGFPCATGEDAGTVDVPCSTRLTITVDGRRVKAVKKKTNRVLSHWTWTMRLRAHQTANVVVAYRAPLVNERYSVPSDGMGLFTYRLTTGARWAGPIGTLDIVVNHLNDALLFVSPAGYRREPGRITWSLVNHEPTEEVVVMPMPMPGLRIAGKTAADVKARLDAGDYAKADVERVLAELARKADFLDTWPAIITRLAGLPAPARADLDRTVAETTAILRDLAARATR